MDEGPGWVDLTACIPLKAGWPRTSSVTPVSIFSAVKGNIHTKHPAHFKNQNKQQSKCKITSHVVNTQEWFICKHGGQCPVTYVGKHNNTIFSPIKSGESHLRVPLKLIKLFDVPGKKHDDFFFLFAISRSEEIIP